MVKRLVFALCLISLSVLQVKGQKKEFEKEWNVGVGFGSTFSSVSFSTGLRNSLPINNLQQFMGGVSVRYFSEKHLGLIAEVNYSQQGWEGKFDEQPQFQHSHKLNYIEIPVLTHIYFGDKVRFFINLGPKVSFLLSDSEEMNEALKAYLASGNVSTEIVTDHYYRMAEKKFDYGLLAGLGMEVRTGIGSFALEGRYSFGFGDIYKNSKSDPFSQSANRVIGAKLTYYMKLF